MRRWLARSASLCKPAYGALAAVVFGCLLAPAARAGALPNCWDLAYGAIRHRATAPHPPFILYDETLLIEDDGSPLLQSRRSVAYRDDGLARILDDRFMNRPIITRSMEPGPPELGPYGDRRSAWLPLQQADYNTLPLIGEVRSKNPSGLSCTNDGSQRYKDHDVYRITFTTTHTDKPSVREMLVDARTLEIWKVILSGYLPVGLRSDPRNAALTDFEVEMAQVGIYLVVSHVTWKYRYYEYSQYSDLFGEYYYSGFEFPSELPRAYFTESVALKAP